MSPISMSLPSAHFPVLGIDHLSDVAEARLRQYPSRGICGRQRVGNHRSHACVAKRVCDGGFSSLRGVPVASLVSVDTVGNFDGAGVIRGPLEAAPADDRGEAMVKHVKA